MQYKPFKELKMRLKYEFLDKIVLFLSCSIVYIVFYHTTLSVLPLLGALSISCFIIVFDKKPFLRYFFYLVFILMCFINLDMVFFIPLIFYDLMNEQLRLLLILPIIPTAFFMSHYGLLDSLLIVVVFVISVFIRFKSSDIMSYKARYYQLIDDTKELTLQLQQNNRNLLDKQDNDIYIATLNERNRIAREIHDHVGHQLSSSILQLGALMALCKDPSTKEQLEQLKKTLNLGMDNIRQSVHNLYDTSIDLDAKLREVIESFTFCPVRYDNSIHVPPNQKQCYAILAIIKEALSNIIKHSNAQNVSITLREHPSLYQLIIHDNGSVADMSYDKGIGLKNMEQRVHLLQGHFTIHTQSGFELFISLPKPINT
jgi:signal transduction histidine kinase